MINLDDLDPPKTTAKAIDLTALSIKELEDYITSLHAEIERAKALIEHKQSHRTGADSLFNL